MKILSTKLFVLLGCALMALPALAAGPFKEGTHYKRLANPVPVRQPSKIEVAEVFSYACGHCYTFESILKPWKEDLPEDVNFVRLHVKWDPTTELLARTLYTAEALGVEDKVDQVIFRTLHVERKPLRSQEQIVNLLAKAGIDTEKFNKTFTSFGITSRLSQGESKIKGSQVSGTPSMLVNGRYVVEARAGVDHKTMLEIVDHLVEQIREERG